MLPPDAVHREIERLHRESSRQIVASLVRLLRDFDRAEEAMHEAFAAALEQWPRDGVPTRPLAWLISAGRFKAVDALRRRGRLEERHLDLAARIEEVAAANAARAEEEIEDDRLRMIFACCHPAIDQQVQVALTLREVCGLSTEEIAAAFFLAPATLAQRIVRGKAKIRDAGVPFAIPEAEELPERLDAVLAVIYLVFTQGYAPSSGAEVTRADLTREAIRLGRLLVELLPEPEAKGLLALMLLQESRRAARSTPAGDLVLLEEQDRSRWDRRLIAEGERLVEEALSSRRFGTYALQGAIAAVHAAALRPEETDWPQIVALYDTLLTLHPSPVVELNRAVALAMRDGSAAGLAAIDGIAARGDLPEYHRLHAARADLLRRAGRRDEARAAYEQALRTTRQEPERRYLARRLAELGP